MFSCFFFLSLSRALPICTNFNIRNAFDSKRKNSTNRQDQNKVTSQYIFLRTRKRAKKKKRIHETELGWLSWDWMLPVSTTCVNMVFVSLVNIFGNSREREEKILFCTNKDHAYVRYQHWSIRIWICIYRMLYSIHTHYINNFGFFLLFRKRETDFFRRRSVFKAI